MVHKDALIVSQLANCKERLFMMPTMAECSYTSVAELNPKRFRVSEGNNAIRIRRNVRVLSALKEKSTMPVCMPDNGGTWIQLCIPYRTAHYTASDPHWRSKEAWQIEMHCTYVHDIHFNRESIFGPKNKKYTKHIKETLT